MMKVYKQKRFKNVMLTLFALAFCAFSFFGLPVSNYASAEGAYEDDYETFYDDFMDMVTQYKSSNEDEISVFSSVDVEENERNYETRLIVTTNEKVDDFGAVASCHYKNHYYFQYEDYYQTDSAYEYFSGLDNVSVMYDYKTTLNGDKIEIKASSYNSWGWDVQNDYTGANSYLNTLLNTVETSRLNGQVVAVLDTGINPNHNLFKNRILTKFAKDYTGEGALVDGAGHGTHVSGTIAEITPSVVKILPIKVLDASGEGDLAYVTAGIDYLIRAKAQIESETGLEFKLMNMSLGIKANSSVASTDKVSAQAIGTYNITGWVEEAYSKGILSIVAAGNSPRNIGGQLIKYSPANIDCAIVVSALAQRQLSDMLLYDYTYSDYGPSVDFSAPGSSIVSAGKTGTNSTEVMSGTSMATPHVTACIALIYLHPSYKNLSFADLNTLLKKNANRSWIYQQNKYALKAGDVRNDYYGYGIINIKNVGMIIEGDIQYSTNNRFSDTAISLKLSASTSVGSGQTIEIHYTTDESADNVSLTDPKYSDATGITINKSTRLLTAAFVKQNGVIVKRSEFGIRYFYIGNKDLESRYKISSLGAIIQYTGTELTKLVVPSSIGGVQVVSINNKAFNDSPVENLILPNTIRSINSNAFDINSNLKEIHCASTSVTVGNYAFQKCSNLKTVDIPNITSLGQLAFAYCNSIDEIKLMKVSSIGKNAFSASTLSRIYIGKGIQSIGSHTQMSLNEVYGYAGTTAESFADANDAVFYDLSVRFFNSLPTQKIIREGQDLSFEFACAGYDIIPTIVGAGSSVRLTQSGDLSKTIVDVTISNLRTGSYNVVANLRDAFGNEAQTNVMRVVVVARDTESYLLRCNDAEYSLYVDGELVTSEYEVFKGQTYTITYFAHAGYNINSVYINDELIKDGTENVPYTITNVSKDIVVNVSTIEKDSLVVAFTSNHGNVYVNGELLTVKNKMVDRNASVEFSIVSDQGWIVRRVLVDGNEISAINGKYRISNITSSKEVEVKYEEANYLIEITFVNSCGICTVDNSGNLVVAHGDSREITITALDGFVIDFVSVNGEIVKITDGKLKLKAIDSDKDIVVSFKPQKVSLFKRDDSSILYYFIVLLILFVLFVIGNVTMKIVRKKKKED